MFFALQFEEFMNKIAKLVIVLSALFIGAQAAQAKYKLICPTPGSITSEQVGDKWVYSGPVSDEAGNRRLVVRSKPIPKADLPRYEFNSAWYTDSEGLLCTYTVAFRTWMDQGRLEIVLHAGRDAGRKCESIPKPDGNIEIVCE